MQYVQYIWLGCRALSKSSTPDLSENTSLIHSHIPTNKTTTIIMSSSGFDNAWSTYVYGNNGSSCNSTTTMKAYGNSSSSTKSWGSSNSSSNMAGSSFGSGSSGFNNAWNAYASGSSGSSAW